MNRQTHEMLNRLVNAGISMDDAYTLRRISMTLHRWHELECGDGNNYASWCITRGRRENGQFIHDDDGKPFIERHSHQGACQTSYTPIPDREAGARKRLDKIVNKYRPALGYYVQTDPRGAPLYILPPGVTRENYNSGIAVYK